MGDLLTKDQLRDTLDRAWRRSWEKQIDRQWRELEDRFKRLTDRENYDKENFEDEG